MGALPWSSLAQIPPWELDAFARTLVAVSFFAIGLAILMPLLREHQWANGMGLATAVIFLSTGVRSAWMAYDLFQEGPAADALRSLTGTWDAALDLVTAIAGLYYWTLRRGFGHYVRGAKLFEDMRERQRQALEIHDNIVQGLTVALMALDLDEPERARESLDETMVAAKRIISSRLGPDRKIPVFDSDLRRTSTPPPLGSQP